MNRASLAVVALAALLAVIPVTCKKNRAPGTPTVTGPLSGRYGDSLRFVVSAIDPDGDVVSYYAEWGDGTTTDWTAGTASGAAETLEHVYADSGRYAYRVKARDALGLESEWSQWDTIPIGYAVPFEPAVPAGPAAVEEWQPCTLATVALSPAHDSVYIQFDWGDTLGPWCGPVASGDTCRGVRAYDTSGTYVVKARARLASGAMSGWSGAHSVVVTAGRPAVPGAPVGPTAGYAHAPVVFEFVTAAPRRQPVRFLVDWGDGAYDSSASVASGDTVALSHAWSAAGGVAVRARAMLTTNTAMISDWSPAANLVVEPNSLPAVPELGSPGFAIPGTFAYFHATTTDPDGDSVSLRFNFGDVLGSWTPFVASGVTVRDSHNYLRPDTVYVKCQARDIRGAESQWSDSEMLVVEQSGLVQWHWWNNNQSRQPPLTSPLVLSGAGTVIYTGCPDGKFYGINASGVTIYTGTQVSFGEVFTGHPTYCPETGHIIVGNTDGELYAFTDGLQRVWHWPGFTRPDSLTYEEWGAAASNGARIYAGRSNDSIYYLRDLGASAALVAAFGLGCGVVDAPTIDETGDILFGTDSGRLYRMDMELATVRWNPVLEPGSRIHSPAITSDGTAIVGSDAGHLFAVRSDGSTKWTADLDGEVGKPVINESTAFVGTSAGQVYAVSLDDGSIRWQRPIAANPILTSPVLTSGGYLYCQDSSDVLYCVRQDGGSPMWACDCPSFLPPSQPGTLGIGHYAGSPAIDTDGNIIVVGERALFLVSGLRGETLAPTGWPKWQHDPSNTGHAGARR